MGEPLRPRRRADDRAPAGRRRPLRRPRGVLVQARPGGEGLLPADPGARRDPRSIRLAAGHRARLLPLARPGGTVNLVILGATGSIGGSALDVAASLGERVRVVGLSCGADWRALARLVERWRPEVVAIADPEAWREAREEGAFAAGPEILTGEEGVSALAALSSADTVLNGIVGAAGLVPTLTALQAGKRVALANKESLVVGGALVTEAAGHPGAAVRFGDPDVRLLPVDSEHNALWQLLEGRRAREVRRVILTASGGPFRETSAGRLGDVTPEEALDHPTWSMGPKITIDSATLANKALEVIEAHWLFGIGYDAIDVVIHPQSIVHGMVETVDGTLFAELGEPDMWDPIRSALTWPERVSHGEPVDLTGLSGLTFERPDHDRFPALAVARAAGEAGGTAPAVFNAANEVAVAAFLDGRIGFLDIAATCERVLESHDVGPADSVDTLLTADRWARERATATAGHEWTPKTPAG
ncbi:MAG: 1-deoxy-D-xylulose-5-phosphate reductoisomerase [Gemmatimonadetes bacterium]|nr:1-deoxy-D-xylulose-5-phosphate reductoisomerase [Gemmatimonadota bacterium]